MIQFPELNENSSYAERAATPKIPVRKIQNLRSYYNLHNDTTGNLKTSIYANSGKSYDLFLQGSFSTEEPFYLFKGEQQFTTKFLNIQKNLGNKEIFMKLISKKKTNIAQISSQNSSSHNPSQENNQTVHELPNNRDIIQSVTSPINFVLPEIVFNNLPKPVSCINYYNCESCNAICNFTINRINKQSQSAITNELQLHGHKGSLQIKTNNRKKYPSGKRWRNLEEAKQELVQCW